MLTVSTKIWLGFLAIVLLGALTMLLAHRGLLRVDREMYNLSQIREPLKTATHEMEINLKGSAIGTLGYLSAPSQELWDLVTDNEEDFERFHAQYTKLATTEEEKQLGQDTGRVYEQFKQQGHDLKTRRDRQAAAFAEALSKLEEIDPVFDQKLPATINRNRADYQNRRQELYAIDEGIDVIRMRLGVYRWSRSPEHKSLIDKTINECRASFQQLRSLEWGDPAHATALAEAQSVFDAAVIKVGEVLSDEDAIQTGIARFINLRLEMDALLDEKMQPLAATNLRQPFERADRTVDAIVFQSALLIPVFLVCAVVASLLLTRTITRPLRALTHGTEAVGRGDLTYRVASSSGDEFAKLGKAFNHMLSRLQDTLVSKELLEKSEHELQRTVQALQEEIAARVRKDEERKRLQASLRRAEVLSAMGTLVAGVAHQVRNPLFGMSSVLDAMEARLGQREEYRRYVEVLRDEASRVTTLMHELMEYGGAGSGEQSIGSLAEAIREALESCGTLSEKLEVTLEDRLDDAEAAILMDRPRLSRAFENLIENAVQHSPKHGTVTVCARKLDDFGREWIEVFIEDGGPGFRDEDLQHVFEPFFTRRPGGTGLGLAIVERIIKGHGGHVTAANRPEGGAVLMVRLPVEVADIATLESVSSNGQ